MQTKSTFFGWSRFHSEGWAERHTTTKIVLAEFEVSFWLSGFVTHSRKMTAKDALSAQYYADFSSFLEFVKPGASPIQT